MRRNPTLSLLLAAIVAVGVVITAALLVAERAEPRGQLDQVTFAAMAAVMLLCQWHPKAWIQVDARRSVTLLPTFAYALVLLGSPAAALAATIVGTLVHARASRSTLVQTLFATARTLVTVGTAGLVVFALDAEGSVTGYEFTPWRWSVAILLVGITILLLDSVITEIAFAMERGVGFVPPLRRSLSSRTTAVGSVLSLAPVWVIGGETSLVLIPLLAVTTVLVVASTQRGMRRTLESEQDPLTSLANRRLFSAQLVDACSTFGGPRFATLLVMDLNGFKHVNDRLGHDVGDAVLVSFARRLQRVMPTNAIAARLGGDEFAALITWHRRPDELEDLLDEIHRSLTAPIEVEGFPVSVGVSVGVAHVHDHGRDPDRVMQAADVAMYRSKRQGTSVEVSGTESSADGTGVIGLLSDLGAAVRDNQLRVDYQPQISMRDGRVVAVEALLRWEHPVHGTIAPNDFIGLAEETDLIGPITEIVLRVAGGGLLMLGEPDARLCVNASVRNLQDEGFAASTLAVLHSIGLPPERLELEITEHALVTKPELTRATIERLREAGVRITVDGFGTGYSSYETLRTLSVDRVKIDRQFVLRLLQDDRDRAIVESVVSLAHVLGLEVVAEGIEADETWNLLAAMGCDAAQGYGIALPMSLVALQHWMRHWHRVALEVQT